MNELKDAFDASIQNEPPVRTTRAQIMRAGHSRRRRRSLTASISGAAVAALVVTAVVALPWSPHDGGLGTAAGSGAATANDKATVVPSASNPADDPADGNRATTDDKASVPAHGSIQLDDRQIPGLAALKASRTAKLEAIVADIKARLTTAGYSVPESGADDSMQALLSGASPSGTYAAKFGLGDGATSGGMTAVRGGVVVVTGAVVHPTDIPTVCPADLPGCSLRHLPDGSTAQLSDAVDVGVGESGRRVIVWGRTVTDVHFIVDDGAPVHVADSLLLAVATSPVLDLADVVQVTPEQRVAIDQAFAAMAATATGAPNPKPTGGTEDVKKGSGPAVKG